MSLSLRLILIVCIVLFLVFIFYHLVKKKMNIQYTLGWLGMALIMLILTIFPQILSFLAKLCGIYNETNLLFILQGGIILILLISITSILSKHNATNRKMAQNIALLEKRIRELENENVSKEDSHIKDKVC